MSSGQYSVCQFFPDGTYVYVRRFVSAEEAVKAAAHYSQSVGARLNDAAIRDFLEKVRAHVDSPDCKCRRCFYSLERPGYWTSGMNEEVTS